jgi:hypothetical protein
MSAGSGEEGILMKLPERSELDALMTTQEQPWVSIFMPTHRPGGAQGQQDPIRLKNLVRQAEERLVAFGLRSSDARKLLGEPHKLLADDLFWRDQHEGLALYCAPSSFRSYKLPLRFDETLVVGARPYVRPILPLFTTQSRFFVLAWSKQHLRFFSASRHAISEVPLTGVPHSLDEAMKYDEFEKPRRARWVQPAGMGRSGHGEGGAAFRGVGVESEASKDNLLRYAQMVDRGLHTVLREERAPLVVAAVDYLIPIYREANTYAHLLDRGAEGNPDALKPEDLHRQAWKVVEPHFKGREEEAVSRFTTLTGTGRASREIREIVPAAAAGRVDTLWVARGVQAWGRYDPTDSSVVLHDSAQAGDQEMLDLAAVQTILHAGTVYPMDRMKAPGEGLLAAIFRY